MRINTRQELEAKRKEYAASLKTQRKQILICAGTGCVAGGSLNIYARMQEILIKRGIKCSLVLEKEPHDESIGLKKSGCHGFCEMGPLLRIEPEGILYVKVQTKDCEEIIERIAFHHAAVHKRAWIALVAVADDIFDLLLLRQHLRPFSSSGKASASPSPQGSLRHFVHDLQIEPEGILYVKVQTKDCEEIIDKSIVADEIIERLVYHDKEGKAYEKQDDIPFYKQQTRVALEDCGRISTARGYSART